MFAIPLPTRSAFLSGSSYASHAPAGAIERLAESADSDASRGIVPGPSRYCDVVYAAVTDTDLADENLDRDALLDESDNFWQRLRELADDAGIARDDTAAFDRLVDAWIDGALSES